MIPLMSYKNKVADAIVNGLLKDRSISNSNNIPSRSHLTRSATISLMRKSFEVQDQIQFNFVGPVSMPRMELPQGIDGHEIQLSH